MNPLYLRIVSDFKAGNEITTKNIKSIYASSDSHTKHTLAFLLKVGAVVKTDRKIGTLIVYVLQQNAYEKVPNKYKEIKKHEVKTKSYIKCDIKELMTTHNPLILKFDALLAEVR
ncbi:hypothetical protein [Providencia sneebia]|uniref:Uncharacterized protein n=1 Tax=Providencia sneebia DSM 19967 TaxID=1141660 RepID=K8WGX5_9GAMM|nr:hypothetical protein [Providencia sneebia]EKT55485.1 hypothetical protein OO7_10894 [Providencia sneebia DSM 19967]EKT55541.1 hypothetical protein OO7_11174 [Providencia sneebia DSM 19967]